MTRPEGLAPPFAPPTVPRAPAPEVSVVIPTFERPALVLEAVASALAQSHRALEVIVVVDGHDDGTLDALGAVGDGRLSVLCPGRHLGNAAARNLGIAAAQAPWVALLDDDDLWMPGKLACQLAAARAAKAEHPVVSCRFLARGEAAEFLWPRRMPEPGQPVGDYLFRRHRPTTGDGVVQTSTVLAPRALFERCPFDPGCARFVDIDWLLRAARFPGFALHFAGGEEPLSVWRMDDRPRVSLAGDWRTDVAWIRARRHLASPRAYGGFVLTLPSIRAARARDRHAFGALLREAFARGRPGWAEIAFHVGNFAFTARVRRLLARLVGGRAEARARPEQGRA